MTASEIVLALIVVLLTVERVWERVWAEQPPVQAVVERIVEFNPNGPVPMLMPEQETARIKARSIPSMEEWDGYEGQAGLS